jgi:hypothetical protein
MSFYLYVDVIDIRRYPQEKVYSVKCATDSLENAKQLIMEHIEYCYNKFGYNIKIETSISNEVSLLTKCPIPYGNEGGVTLCPRKLSDAEFDAYKQLTPSRSGIILCPRSDRLRCPTPYCSDVESDDEETF